MVWLGLNNVVNSAYSDCVSVQFVTFHRAKLKVWLYLTIISNRARLQNAISISG